MPVLLDSDMPVLACRGYGTVLNSARTKGLYSSLMHSNGRPRRRRIVVHTLFGLRINGVIEKIR